MLASPIYLQAASAGQGGGAAAFMSTILPMVVLVFAFYLLLIRPQQRRAKSLQDMIGSLKKGDQVVTAGGLVGKVTKVEDQHVELELGPNVKVRAVKATIAEVLTSSAKPAND